MKATVAMVGILVAACGAQPAMVDGGQGDASPTDDGGFCTGPVALDASSSTAAPHDAVSGVDRVCACPMLAVGIGCATDMATVLTCDLSRYYDGVTFVGDGTVLSVPGRC